MTRRLLRRATAPFRPATLLAAAFLLPSCSETTGPGPWAQDPCESGAAPLGHAVGAGSTFAGPAAAAFCLDGGAAGTEYIVTTSNVAADYGTRVVFDLRANGVALPIHQLPPSGTLAGGLGVQAAGGQPALVAHAPDDAFHLGLLERARAELEPLMEDARLAQRLAGGIRVQSAGVNPNPGVVIGELLTINTNSKQACTSPSWRTGRVTHISERAIVVSDTANPANGFTASDFQHIALTFDTLVVPAVLPNFGEPTDIDGNGRVLIFFTRAVNELTPRNSEQIINGFVYARDLYPKSGSGSCAASNFAELFYMLAPDPTGVVNGNQRSRGFVLQVAVSTLAHELQHLINAGRRLYVNNANTFEQVWLDEGLAHMAEELLFYRASGLEPRSNIDSATVTQNPLRVNAFNTHMAANVTRFRHFLDSTAVSSPYNPRDALATRGASWHFLRYASDRKLGDEAQTWFQLANSTTAGMQNLSNVFGVAIPPLLADWHTAILADDAVQNRPPAWDLRSWNLRSIYAALAYADYPATVGVLANDVPVRATLYGGSVAWFRLRVPPGARAAVYARPASAATLPAGYVTTVLRYR
jgi:hypothetical protein